MDLGALELQIFVSLVVVLGSAFVALICDYLKGNNEQLRERNIELRVRTEERERFAILNPAAWLSQFRGDPAAVSNVADAPPAPVAAESVMESHATAEGLAQVAEREASLMSRAEAGVDTLAAVPSVAGFDVSERRKSRRKRGSAGETADTSGESSYDWVRPDVMARVERRAGGGQRPAEEETTEVVAAVESTAQLLPAPVVAEKPLAAPIPGVPVPVEFAPLEPQAEMEHVARPQTRPASTPPVIMLRPLPAMKLADELQRIADTAQVAPPSYTSQLLEDVIAASAAKPSAMAEAEEILVVEVADEAVLSPAIPALAAGGIPLFFKGEIPDLTSRAIDPPPAAFEPLVEEPETAFAFAALEDAAALTEAPSVAFEPLAEEPERDFAFEMSEYAGSALGEVLMTPNATAPEPSLYVEELPFPTMAAVTGFEPSSVEELSTASAVAFPTYDSLPPVVETPAYDWSGAEFAPLPETVFASEAFSSEVHSELPVLEAVSSTESLVQPTLAAPSKQPTVAESQDLSELLLPTGMQDVATYFRLLEMPNPMSGIVITISITEFNRLSDTVGEKDLPSLLDSVQVLMSSMVRDGDFGVKLAADQWVFVYRIDDNGFSQRRVAGLSEKLWDFQLRHLGLSNISFIWAAVNVHGEPMSDAVTAAVERMEASRRGTKKSGAQRARLVVNG